jgi:hypothetical protein
MKIAAIVARPVTEVLISQEVFQEMRIRRPIAAAAVPSSAARTKESPAKWP